MTTDPDTDTSPDTVPTTEILRAAATGDSAAWAELIRRYTPVVQARMRPYRLQEADRHDVAQTAWMRLAENITGLHTPEHLGGWLATVVARESLRVRQTATRAVLAGDLLAETTAHPGPGPEQLVTDAEVARTLWTAVDALPPARRDLLRALFVDGDRSYADISAATGTPVGGIGPTRGRAIRQLRPLLVPMRGALR